MQINLAQLTKRAIDTALKANWKEAITLNTEIIEKDPSNIEAKNRLGRAYLQVGEYSKAKKVLKEVLDTDPINQVALKNLKHAQEKKHEKSNIAADTRALIKEPGTSTETDATILAKRIFAADLAPGEPLEIKVERNHLNFFRIDSSNLLASIDHDVCRKVISAKKQGAVITANFVSGEGKDIKILIKSSLPVFRWEKQDVRPYIKKGSIEEPELEIPDLEE